MSLKRTLAGAAVPYEILLDVLDILIKDAECQALNNATYFWCLYRHDVSARLVVFDDFDGSPRETPQRRRFRTLRLASQINQKTRAMVHKKFIRIPMERSRAVGDLTVDAWVYPEADFFIPKFAQEDMSFAEMEHYYLQTIRLPPPDGFRFLQCVHQIYLPSIDFIHETNSLGVSALALLPSLKHVTFNVGKPSKRLTRPNELHHGLIPMSVAIEMFPDLESWYETAVTAFPSLWRPLAKRGIRLYGKRITGDKGPFIELVNEKLKGKDTTGIRFMRPNCVCCLGGIFGGNDQDGDD